MTDRFHRWVMGIAVLAVGVYALLAETLWTGGWQSTIDRLTGATVLTGPALAAVAAGLHVRAVVVRPISRSTARGRWVPYRSALEAWALGMGVFLTTVGIGVVCTLSIPHGGPAQWWALTAGALVLGLSALFGAACAHLVPHPITVVGVGPVLFLLGAFGPAPLPEVLRFGPTLMTGVQYDLTVCLCRFGAIVALSLCLAVGMGPWQDWARPTARALGLGITVGLVASATAAVVMSGVGDSRLEPSDERATKCASGTPVMCVAPSHARYLKAVRRSADESAPVLVDAGVALPDTYSERFGAARPPAGDGSFYVDQYRSGQSFRDAVLLLARPADCPQWHSSDGPPYAAWDAEQVITEWAIARNGRTPAAISPEMEQWMPRIGDAATTAWVRTTFALLRSCDLDSIVMPWDRR